MYRKAVCFHDKQTAAKILNTNDAAHIKALDRLVSNYDGIHWNGIRQIAVYAG